MNARPPAAASPVRLQRPKRRAYSAANSSCWLNTQPTATNAPAHNTPPRPLATRNSRNGIRVMPASGGAIVLKPGMNLATTSERGPCLEKIVSVRLTHESGSSEMRQSHPSTRAPPSRPTTYQAMSAISEAMPDSTRTSARLSFPLPARPPAASRNGIAGIGMPICSARTEPKTTR